MSKRTTPQYSSEVRDRAVRMVHEHERAHPGRWAALLSISEKIGCAPETLRRWLLHSEREASGASAEMSDRLKELERENRELRQANEILRKASAYFARAELDRRPKR